uniref:F-box domain-containing protein n=1 Tax=Steinernema glaseri TaxID=37863 RepID=A0A1I7YXY3_9BILA
MPFFVHRFISDFAMLTQQECIGSDLIYSLTPASMLTVMDRVPICFIEDVLLQLERLQVSSYGKFPQYPSIWGKVAARKCFRISATLAVFLVSKKEAVFYVTSNNKFVPLGDLEEFTVEVIQIYKSGQPTKDCYPMTKANLQLLQKHLRRGYPCGLTFDANFSGVALVEQLCLAPSRLTELQILNCQLLPTEILTQNINRGTLRCLLCSNGVHVTNEFFPVLLRFVASEQFEKLNFDSSSGPVSSRICLMGVINAFLSTPRRKKFSFVIPRLYEDCCSHLTTEDVQERVSVHFHPTKPLFYIYPSTIL